MTHKNYAPLHRRTIALAVGSALATLTAPAFADPMLTVKLFRDADVLFRDADMSRWADDYIELGLGYNSKGSLRFGQFTGLTDKGAFPIAGFNWLSRGADDDAKYWHAYGSNLGLDSRKLLAEGGIQGRWNVSASVDELTKSQTDTAKFVHDGLGTNTLTLPTGFTRVALATSVPASSLKSYEIQQTRDIYRFGVNGLLGPNWDYKVTYREDQRGGTRMTGFAVSTGQGLIVPYSIDDQTRQVEGLLSYASKVAQLQFGYTYSRYENDAQRLRMQSPYSGSTLENQMSLPPGNDFFQVNATGAYNFSKTTRLTATASRGVARQNETFLPYSVNGPGATAALPRNSLDGKVVNSLLDVALTAKPLDKMNLKVGYQYRESDNRTPIAQYTYVGRDASTAVPTLGTVAGFNTIRSNAPVSTKEQKVLIDADYEVAKRTILRAGVEHAEKKYTLTDRTQTETDKVSLELRRPVSDEFLGSVGYVYTQRRGSDYDKNTFFRNSYTDPAWQINTAGGSLTNHPSMRSFMYSDFNEERVRASGNWTITETLSMQGGVDRYQRRHKSQDCGTIIDPKADAAIGAPLPDTCLGRTAAEGTTANVDFQWQPEENLTTFAFLNYSELATRQAGRTWRPDLANTVANNSTSDESISAADQRRDWFGTMTYRDQAFGLGLKWQPDDAWDLGGTYVYSYGKSISAVTQGSAPQVGTATAATVGNAGALTAATPLPNAWTRLHSLQLFAKWTYSKQLDWRFNYLYENMKAYDWANDGVAFGTNGNVLLTGQTSPRYSNHVFGVSAVIKNW